MSGFFIKNPIYRIFVNKAQKGLHLPFVESLKRIAGYLEESVKEKIYRFSLTPGEGRAAGHQPFVDAECGGV
ncbi:MAG: hypothetical protein PHG96_07830 [Kiritimatiellae bacterium]|nr:hypothetical protein [Kiritimatiellia bacterium]